jgi:hypothetical protein
MRKRRPAPADAALVASMSRQCAAAAPGDALGDAHGDTTELSAAGPAVLGSKANGGKGNVVDKFGEWRAGKEGGVGLAAPHHTSEKGLPLELSTTSRQASAVVVRCGTHRQSSA